MLHTYYILAICRHREQLTFAPEWGPDGEQGLRIPLLNIHMVLPEGAITFLLLQTPPSSSLSFKGTRTHPRMALQQLQLRAFLVWSVRGGRTKMSDFNVRVWRTLF